MIWHIIGLVTLAAVGLAETGVQGLRLLGATPSRGIVYPAALLLDALVLAGMLERRAPIFGRVFWRGPRNRRVAAITFDDGPTERYTPRILDILRERDAKATFFALGHHAERLPHVLARAVAEGHEVGNHGYDHAVLPLRGPVFIRGQIARTSEVIERATAVRPRLFRASHGWRNPWVNREARRAGCMPVAWTVGVWDTDRPGSTVIEQRVARGMSPGCVLLLHDGRGMEPDADASQVVEALPGIIDAFRRQGYQLVTMSELMGRSKPAGQEQR